MENLNRFKEDKNKPKEDFLEEMNEEILKEVKAEPRDKYIVNIRFNGELEGIIRRAAYKAGLPITKYIEQAVRQKLKDDGLL